jgi:hypothetical protein
LRFELQIKLQPTVEQLKELDVTKRNALKLLDFGSLETYSQAASVKLVLCFEGACLGHLQKALNLSGKQMM